MSDAARESAAVKDPFAPMSNLRPRLALMARVFSWTSRCDLENNPGLMLLAGHVADLTHNVPDLLTDRDDLALARVQGQAQELYLSLSRTEVGDGDLRQEDLDTWWRWVFLLPLPLADARPGEDERDGVHSNIVCLPREPPPERVSHYLRISHAALVAIRNFGLAGDRNAAGFLHTLAEVSKGLSPLLLAWSDEAEVAFHLHADGMGRTIPEQFRPTWEYVFAGG